jgi:hypothetical protein
MWTQEWQVLEKVKNLLDPSLCHGEQAFLIVYLIHHSKMAVSFTRNSSCTWLVIV